MNKVKWLFAVCLINVFICIGSAGIGASETEIDEDVFYIIKNDDGTVSIDGCHGHKNMLVVPSEIDGRPVKSIDRLVSTYLEHVIIQEGITEIKEAAFEVCNHLETVVLPEGITVLNDEVFRYCESLNSINIPSTVKSIGNYTFASCWNLKNVALPEGLARIGDGAFAYIRNLNIVVPDSVEYISGTAFYYSDNAVIHANPDSYARKYADSHNIRFSCINHSNIVTAPEIQPTCISEGKTAGTCCSVCGTFIVPQNPINKSDHVWDSGKVTEEATVKKDGIKTYACTVCGKTRIERLPRASVPKKGRIIFDQKGDSYRVTNPRPKNGIVEFVSSRSSKNSVSIPSTVQIVGITYKVTSIAKDAFKNNKNLKRITINSNITKIDVNAFSGCSSLKTIIIKSKNLQSVGKNAFKGINPKAKIKVPSDRLDRYKKLLGKKGQKASVRITK